MNRPLKGHIWTRPRCQGLPTICQAEVVTFFTPSALLAHNESGWHHSTYDDVAWPSGYAGVGRQYGVRPGHAAVPSPVTPHTRCCSGRRTASRRVPCDTAPGVSEGYKRVASPPGDACHFAS